MLAEKSIEQYLVRHIKQMGGICVKMVGYNGFPDRMVLLNGFIYFIEMKAPGGRLSEVQKARHRQLKKMGFNVCVLWNYMEVDRFLSEVKKYVGYK